MNRRGVSILEVVFAIAITSIGLLGAIGVFVVAGSQAKTAKINDMAAAAGRSMVHRFDTMGMRRPDRWLAWDQAKSPPQFVAALAVSNYQRYESLCIDPQFVAAQFISGGGVLPPAARTFAYHEPFIDQNGDGSWQPSESFTDLNNNGYCDPFQNSMTFAMNAAGVASDVSFMRRITLRSSAGGGAMTLLQARSIFEIQDDLIYQKPDDRSKPAAQEWATPAGPAAKRLSDGKFSWFATLVPQVDISGVPSDQYVLSIVVCHERDNSLPIDAVSERTAWGVLTGDGTTGGEILLTASDPEQLKIKPNSWVMLSGTYPVVPGLPGQPPQPFSRFQWYRVSDREPEPTLNANNPPHQQYELSATLIGQSWNTSFISGGNFVRGGTTYTMPMPPGTVPAVYNRVTIVDGVVAVYEKTVRLEYGSTF